MKKLYILTILLCLTGFGSIFAQTLKGHIYDAKTVNVVGSVRCV